MSQYTLVATSSFGIESVVAQELRDLGYHGLNIENGRVLFSGDDKDIARCNIWLRTADRVLIKIAEFKATDYDELFREAQKVIWEEMIPFNGKMHVVGKSVRSRLTSVRDCQAIVKKAIIQAMRRKYNIDQFPESGPVYKIEISLLNDIGTITVDTTGQGLHKRGYREDTGRTPLRENLAAALVLLSRWTSSRVLADPFCGSGTIPIEAALIGKNIAPGVNRSFASEAWQHMTKELWDNEREDARKKENSDSFRIFASDSDRLVLRKAQDNAVNARVGDLIAFQRQSIENFSSARRYGCLICNPPYGERVGDQKEVERLYRSLGDVLSRLNSWSFFILTSHKEFESYLGKKANKNRKLYNGNMKCYYYEYFGPLPPKKSAIE